MTHRHAARHNISTCAEEDAETTDTAATPTEETNATDAPEDADKFETDTDAPDAHAKHAQLESLH